MTIKIVTLSLIIMPSLIVGLSYFLPWVYHHQMSSSMLSAGISIEGQAMIGISAIVLVAMLSVVCSLIFFRGSYINLQNQNTAFLHQDITEDVMHLEMDCINIIEFKGAAGRQKIKLSDKAVHIAFQSFFNTIYRKLPQTMLENNKQEVIKAIVYDLGQYILNVYSNTERVRQPPQYHFYCFRSNLLELLENDEKSIVGQGILIVMQEFTPAVSISYKEINISRYKTVKDLLTERGALVIDIPEAPTSTTPSIPRIFKHGGFRNITDKFPSK